MKRRSSATALNERCSSPIIKKTKVHAQRKFAQGCNNYVTTPTKLSKPNDSPAQLFSPETNTATDNDDRELNNFSNLPTIDDFLTFLCYRETNVLPQRLNYLNTPQFENIPAKKKPQKSNSASSSSLPSSKSNTDRDKASDRITTNFKNKKKVPEYTLRSKEIKCKPIISKASRSLALKHNQRLRKIVQSKFIENKVPNFKVKSTLNKLPDSKNNVDVKVNNVKNHTITKTVKHAPKINDLEVKRVTRRNSNLNALAEKPDVKSSVGKLQTKSVSPSVTIPNTVMSAKRSKTSPIKTRSSTARLNSNFKTPSTSSRPTRKTKEAATLYMETLGKDLLRGDESCDEDDLSVENFFEIPSIDPAKPKKEIKEQSKKLKAADLVKRNAQKLNKNLVNKKIPKKVSDKNYKSVKKIIKKDKKVIEKLNDELKKIVEDKPLKEKLENITKSINIDKELETIDQTLSNKKSEEVSNSSKSCTVESSKDKKEPVVDKHKDNSLEVNQNSITPDKKTEKFEIPIDYDGIENIDIPEFVVNSKDDRENIKNHTLSKNVSLEHKIKNNVPKKDKIVVENIENILLPEATEEKRTEVTNTAQQKEKIITNSKKTNCSKKPAERMGNLNITSTHKRNCSKKLVKKIENPNVSKVPLKNCFKKPIAKIVKTEISNSATRNCIKNTLEQTEKIDVSNSTVKNSLKKPVEKKLKSEVSLKNSTEKTDSVETPLKTPVEKIEKSEALLKKSIEKNDHIEVPLKKPNKKTEKSETLGKKSTEKVDKIEVPQKKPIEKIEKSKILSKTQAAKDKKELLVKKSSEKLEKSETPVEKTAEKTVVLLKKPSEKLEKSETSVEKTAEKTVVLLKKPSEKLEKSGTSVEKTAEKTVVLLKKPSEKLEKSETSVEKTADKAEKLQTSNPLTKNCLKKPAEKIEKPEILSKKLAEKVEKSDILSKKRTEQPAILDITTKNCLKKPAEKTEKSTSAPKQNIPASNVKDGEKEPTVVEKSLPHKITMKTGEKETPNVEENIPSTIPPKIKNVEKPKSDNSTDEEHKTNEKKPISETDGKTLITKKNLNRKKSSVKIIRAKNIKLDREGEKEEKTAELVTVSETLNVEDSVTESKINDRPLIHEKVEDDVTTKSIPKLVFANGKPTTTEECSQKPIIQTIATSSSKMFCLESKKIIFKKNKTPTVTDDKEDSSPRKTEAFSADNENSVYAFEPDLPTTSPPFRRLKPVTPPKSLISGNSIAVQVNFESNAKIECSSSSETQVSSTTDCDDRVFYIPIQTSDTNSTLGVAVKLDTDGANQKIIMSATLVTKSPSFTTSTATTVASKPITFESSTPQIIEHTELPKKPTSEENIDKIVATADSQSSAPQTPIDSPSSTVVSPKSNKKVSSTTSIATTSSKANQSVKIVKINKVKKPLPPKPKPKPVKSKSSKSKPAEVTKSTPSTSANEILEAPTFYPSETEFNDPLKYIDTIRSVAEKFGVCRIVPPSTFRPECKVADEMRFTAYNHYVHKMLHRWGPNVKEMMAIRKFLATQNIQLTHAPLIGGMEVDLPRLYQIVQQCGGLKAVIEKERWHQVADVMKIPKLAQDRITKLDDIYCKYLLPYDILPHDEREKLFDEVEKDWNVHLKNPNDDNEVFDDVDECIVKGRTMPLSCFYRIARNTMMMCFGSTEGQEGPSTETIETEFWNHVSQRKSHICVHSGSIDTGVHGYGFSTAKNSTFRKHPWNLKVLTNNSASILRSLGPIMGVTVPTLHVGMLYSACCWYRDPHGLPWVEYLHTGANKIWYGIPDEFSEQFSKAMRVLVPRYCRDKRLWLPSDTVMIPPPLLAAQNVPLSRVVQQPGQFIVVFPKAFTSCISTGYMVSESVYFAHASWLNSAKQIFSDMQESCEPSVFSLEQLLISVATDVRVSFLILGQILPLLVEVHDTEIALRNQLVKLGLSTSQLKINKKRKPKASFNDEDNYECEVCRANLFLSLVMNSHDETNYCLKHAVNLLQKKPAQVKHCKLMYAYTEGELEEIIKKIQEKIETKSSRKPNPKQNSN